MLSPRWSLADAVAVTVRGVCASHASLGDIVGPDTLRIYAAVCMMRAATPHIALDRSPRRSDSRTPDRVPPWWLTVRRYIGRYRETDHRMYVGVAMCVPQTTGALPRYVMNAVSLSDPCMQDLLERTWALQQCYLAHIPRHMLRTVALKTHPDQRSRMSYFLASVHGQPAAPACMLRGDSIRVTNQYRTEVALVAGTNSAALHLVLALERAGELARDFRVVSARATSFVAELCYAAYPEIHAQRMLHNKPTPLQRTYAAHARASAEDRMPSELDNLMVACATHFFVLLPLLDAPMAIVVIIAIQESTGEWHRNFLRALETLPAHTPVGTWWALAAIVRNDYTDYKHGLHMLATCAEAEPSIFGPTGSAAAATDDSSETDRDDVVLENVDLESAGSPEWLEMHHSNHVPRLLPPQDMHETIVALLIACALYARNTLLQCTWTDTTLCDQYTMEELMNTPLCELCAGLPPSKLFDLLPELTGAAEPVGGAILCGLGGSAF